MTPEALYVSETECEFMARVLTASFTACTAPTLYGLPPLFPAPTPPCRAELQCPTQEDQR